MPGFKRKIASVTAAAALVVSSTATAAAVAPPAFAAQAPQNSWLTLSMLTQSGAIGLAGAAGQPMPQSDSAPPPPPPPPPPRYGSVQTPPIPVIAIWLATLAMAVYIATLNERGHGQFPVPPPNSPA